MNDLRLTRRQFEVLTSDREMVDLVRTGSDDLSTVEARENLAQAIINRLLTRQGELRGLGHPRYGSRLHELVGEVNNLRIQGKAALFIRECLEQERRIQKITGLAFAPPDRLEGRSELRVQVTVLPAGDDQEMSIVIPVVL